LNFPRLNGTLASGWKRVRHAPKNGPWYSTTDDVKGTHAAYGNPKNDAAGWNVKFNYAQVRQYLFALSNGKKWVVMNKYSVNGKAWLGNPPIVASSASSSQKTTYNHNSNNNSYQPSITYDNTGEGDSGQIYVEGGWSGYKGNLRLGNGADVYVR